MKPHERFGPEWEKEMMKWSKGHLIEQLRRALIDANTHTEMRKVLEANGFESFGEAIAEAKKYRAAGRKER